MARNCFHLTRLGVVSLLLSGCGYVGLDETLSTSSDGLGGETSSSGGRASGDSGGGAGETGGTSGDGGSTASGGSSSGGNDTGTGGKDAGSGGASGGSASVPGYPCSTDCDDPFLLYRSFELGTPVLPQVTGGATVERSTTIVHAGEHSMQFTQGSPGSHARLNEEINLVSTGDLYFRSWVYVPSDSISNWINLLILEGATSPGIEINARASGVIDSHARTDFELASSEEGVVPRDSWFCLQVHLVVKDDAGSVNVAVNSKNVLNQSGVDTKPGEGIERVVYGLGYAAPGEIGASAYFDEVVVSREPLACN